MFVQLGLISNQYGMLGANGALHSRQQRMLFPFFILILIFTFDFYFSKNTRFVSKCPLPADNAALLQVYAICMRRQSQILLHSNARSFRVHVQCDTKTRPRISVPYPNDVALPHEQYTHISPPQRPGRDLNPGPLITVCRRSSFLLPSFIPVQRIQSA